MSKAEERDLIDAALDVMQRRSGWIFPDSRSDEVSRAIRKIWRVAGQLSAAAFSALLEADSTLFDRLVDELAIGETYFFREPAHFELIRNQIIPGFLARDCREPISVWSAGCASGEEAYSLAILFEQEALAQRVRIVGTDLSSSALRSAQEARYRSWSLRGSDVAFIERYFEKDGEYVRLSERLRKHVRYERHNLCTDMLPSFVGKPDLILCRNVMIYFDTATIARLARLLFDALAEDGWLLTAPADPLLTTYAPFVAVKTPAGLAYRRPSDGSAVSENETARQVRRARRDSLSSHVTSTRFRKVSSRPIKVRHPPTRRVVPGSGGLSIGMAAATDVEGLVLHLRALADAGDLSAAGEEVDRALERLPLNPALHYLRAIISLGQGKDGQAIEALRRTIYLDRGLAVAHFALGAVLRRLGDIDLARRAFENTVAICDASAPEQLLPQGEGETAAVLANAARRELSRMLGNRAL
jgi:chemotaxis protein methyltransferase CheR